MRCNCVFQSNLLAYSFDGARVFNGKFNMRHERMFALSYYSVNNSSWMRQCNPSMWANDSRCEFIILKFAQGPFHRPRWAAAFCPSQSTVVSRNSFLLKFIANHLKYVLGIAKLRYFTPVHTNFNYQENNFDIPCKLIMVSWALRHINLVYIINPFRSLTSSSPIQQCMFLGLLSEYIDIYIYIYNYLSVVFVVHKIPIKDTTAARK